MGLKSRFLNFFKVARELIEHRLGIAFGLKRPLLEVLSAHYVGFKFIVTLTSTLSFGVRRKPYSTSTMRPVRVFIKLHYEIVSIVSIVT